MKHLVCNDSETDRRYYDVQISQRALREFYLRPFEIAVDETDVWAIMTAYNKVVSVNAIESSGKLMSPSAERKILCSKQGAAGYRPGRVEIRGAPDERLVRRVRCCGERQSRSRS